MKKQKVVEATNEVDVCTGEIRTNLTLFANGDIGITKIGRHHIEVSKRVSVGNKSYTTAYRKLIRQINEL